MGLRETEEEHLLLKEIKNYEEHGQFILPLTI